MNIQESSYQGLGSPEQQEQQEQVDLVYDNLPTIKELLKTLTSLDIESASNDTITTLKTQIKLLMRLYLPYNTNTRDGEYRNGLLASLYEDYQKLSETTIHPATLARIEKNLQAICEHNLEYNNNRHKGDLTVQGTGLNMIMYTNKSGVSFQPIAA